MYLYKCIIMIGSGKQARLQNTAPKTNLVKVRTGCIRVFEADHCPLKQAEFTDSGC